MLRGRSLRDVVEPAVAGALVVALIWAIVEIGPTAAQRWFAF